MEKINALCETKAEDFPAGEFFALSPVYRDICLNEMVKHKRADLLVILKEGAPSSGDAKAIRKSLHRLRSRGIHVDEKEEEKAFVIRSKDRSQELAFATPMGAAGDQAIWLWKSHRGAKLMFQVFLSDSLGFIDILPAKISLAKFERMIDDMKKRIGRTPIIEIPPDHARWLISRAEDITRKTGRHFPEGYNEVKFIIGALPSPDEKNPIHEMLDMEKIMEKRGMLYEAPALLDHPVFHGWYFGREAVDSCKFRLQEADASPLVMNEIQKQERMEGIFEEEAKKAVENEGKEFWAGRLLENAYFLVLLGDMERAEQAVSVAMALEGERLPLFFTAVMRRSFQAQQENEEKKPEGGLIIP